MTAGDLVFWGDQNRRLRAFDADSGKVLWQTIVGGMVMNSTISYAVSGKQYVMVFTGGAAEHYQGQLAPAVQGHNARCLKARFAQGPQPVAMTQTHWCCVGAAALGCRGVIRLLRRFSARPAVR